jgi:hypothetical protein
MVQPKYNPQEALERVKLMMNYDLSKTSVENKKVIEEQTQKSSDPFACVKNYYTSKNIKFKEGSGSKVNEKYIQIYLTEKITWTFNIENDPITGDFKYWYEKVGEDVDTKKGFGRWECDGNSNFIINKTDNTIYKSTQATTTQTTQPVQTQPKTDTKQDTLDPSKPQKLKPKDSPLGTTLKDTSIPKRSCVVYVNQLYEAFTRYREGFDPDQINNLRKYVQRCMDDHFPSGSRQGNWGITGLGGSETDQKLLKLSACPMKFVGRPNSDIVDAPAPPQSGPISIFRLVRKC